jgi:hypothetical protein
VYERIRKKNLKRKDVNHHGEAADLSTGRGCAGYLHRPERCSGEEGRGDKPKAGETTLAIPPADTLTLSENPNVVSKTGCPVIARPWNSSNPNWIYPGQPLNFVKVPGGQVPFSGKTNAKGILPWTVPWNTTIRAEVPSAPNKPPLLISNDFKCSGGPLLPEK